MYDWAKSAYETTVLGAVLPVYFVVLLFLKKDLNLEETFTLVQKFGALQLVQPCLFFFNHANNWSNSGYVRKQNAIL